MLFLYRYLLQLYPAGYRMEFAEEMMAVLHERRAEAVKKGLATRCALYARETGGLLSGAVQEHFRAMAGFYPWAGFPFRRIGMRSEFRFPKATTVLMMVILVAVVMAIEKARAIQTSIPQTHTQVGPIASGTFTVLPSFALLFLITCAAGAIGWAMVHALRRSGVQRLEELRPSGK